MKSVDSKAVVHLTRAWSVKKPPEVSRVILTKDKLRSWGHLRDVQFSNSSTSKIDILIGSDVPEANWIREQMTSKWNESYAARTTFVWTLMGPMSHRKKSASDVHTLQVQDIHSDSKRLHNMEFIDWTSGKEQDMSIEDRKALTTLQHPIILKDGQYEIGLPWRTDPLFLPDNRCAMFQRLQTLRTRFQRDRGLLANYGRLYLY
ncbi:hypothetical protein EG68_01847 [Paragonimus skrjabini miyazakii]|uniref:Uncharacterized protein n=1 Tax=Paragonimus skrjabini miyazakii TaxID=59628 RepID=A0A8S9Z587_9TREM|nr:hypothetical protein EG68_01847 [Paragonimus skrjabini miyazakii]